MEAPLPGPGAAIRAMRKRSGLTLTELASLAVSTLSKLEMGHAYLKASDARCRTITTCSARGRDETRHEGHLRQRLGSARRRAQPAAPHARRDAGQAGQEVMRG